VGIPPPLKLKGRRFWGSGLWSKGTYFGRACGFSGHADVVGAMNIRDNLLISRLRRDATCEQAAVNQPTMRQAITV